MKFQKRHLVIFPVLAVAFLTSAESCESESAPAPDSDSSQNFADGAKVPIDDNVYLIKGEVIGEVNATTRQITPAEGSISGFATQTYGSLNGSFTGPVEAGKGFVRIRVETSSPETDLAPLGDVTIIKTSDTKVKALLNGDIVSFKCRRQYEALAAVKDNEKFDADKVQTWELDYCRLATPVIEVKPDPQVEVK